MAAILKVHESTTATGALLPTWLELDDGVLSLVIGQERYDLPPGALAAVMARYGAPYDPDQPVTLVATLDLGQGRALRHVRHLAGYDVIARDYLVYEPGPGDALCAMATSVAGALAHLGRAARDLARDG